MEDGPCRPPPPLPEPLQIQKKFETGAWPFWTSCRKARQSLMIKADTKFTKLERGAASRAFMDGYNSSCPKTVSIAHQIVTRKCLNQSAKTIGFFKKKCSFV
jgi:hypothetical protein